MRLGINIEQLREMRAFLTASQMHINQFQLDISRSFLIFKSRYSKMSPSTQSTSALECSLGCLSRSDGSSSFALNGTTKVLCSVYGPGEVKLMKELSNRAAILITYKPRVGQPTNKVCMYLNGISDLNWFGHVLTLPVCALA